MPRPAVDVVVPFLGSPAELVQLTERLDALRLEAGDTLTVADNGPQARGGPGRPRVVAAPERRTPAHARNVGAAGGSGDWILFVDADTRPAPDLLERLFDPAPAEHTGVLAGGVAEAPGAPGGREAPAARWARLTRAMSQDNTLNGGRWSFAQTVNCAVRRHAFEAVCGFRAELRACEDADLCFRLAAAGWRIERRERATVTHLPRPTLHSLVRQQLVHGAGRGWLEDHYPGSAPAHRWPGYLAWGLRDGAGRLARAARGRDADAALLAVTDPLVAWAREAGRRRSNVVAPGGGRGS